MSHDINSYLAFKLGVDNFALHVGKVIEIMEYVEPQKVPNGPSFMHGVLKHRGEMIPIIDTGVKFNMKQVSISTHTCIIVLEVDKGEGTVVKLGIMVDSVSDVFEASVEELLLIQNDYRPAYISHSYSINDNFYLILDSNMVFSGMEVIELDSILGSIKTE